MGTKFYREQLHEYKLDTLQEVRTIADWLTLRNTSELTTKGASKEWDILLIPEKRLGQIVDEMRYEWDIFKDHENGPTNREQLRQWPINAGNLDTLLSALERTFDEKSPHRIKFVFDKHRVGIQQKGKVIAISEVGTYQDGLLRALAEAENGRFGFIRTVDTVLGIMDSVRRVPFLNTDAEKRDFIKGIFKEIQRNLKAARFGGLFTLKWSNGLKNVQLVMKPK